MAHKHQESRYQSLVFILNRVAYGYRNFTNYKNRIMIHFKLKPVDSKLGGKQKETYSEVA